MKKRQTPFTSIGIPSLFLIFSVLCLVILSLLTLETSRSDLRNSQLSLAQTTAYYEACSTATDICTQAADYITRSVDTGNSKASGQSKEIPGITEEIPELTWDEASSRYTFDTSINDTQVLHVEFLLTGSVDGQDSPLEILCWQTRTQGDWIPDTRQAVYKGDTK